jgi:DNA-binding MarR family transcriptional regulator
VDDGPPASRTASSAAADTANAIGDAAADRIKALEFFQRTGRESSRLSVMLRAAIAARSGLTVSDAECLDFLVDAGSATAGQLAERVHLTSGAITGMIRRLAAAGYVTSHRDPADGRRVIITAIPSRLNSISADYADYVRASQALLEDYSTDELRFLARHQQRLSRFYATQLSVLRADEAASEAARAKSAPGLSRVADREPHPEA